MELKTPLYDCHVACGGKIVPFAGYLLPVQYGTGVITEHQAVRNKAGLFDVSHMGEVFITGKDALANVNNILTNDFTNMVVGQVRYSPMCNEKGGIVDDMVVCKMSEEKYLLVVNAANRKKDVDWIKAHVSGNVTVQDDSDNWAQLALQGPLSTEILSKLTDPANIPEKYYTFNENVAIGGMNCLLSQTGYTGETGYEIYLSNADAPKMWELLLETGKDLGLIPCGLGARDTLRLEASMPLYGHEMTDDIDPLEAGLKFAVKMKKDNFIGKKAIEEKGPSNRKRVGLKITGRGIARENEKIFAGDKEVGFTTSGTMAPYLGYAVAMAYVELDYAEVGTALEVEVRGRRITAETVPMPFYKKA